MFWDFAYIFQIKSFGAALTHLQPQLLHYWKALFILVPFATKNLGESGFSSLLHLRNSTLCCVLSIGLSITSSKLKNEDSVKSDCFCDF